MPRPKKAAVGRVVGGRFRRRMCAQNLQVRRRNAELLGRFKTLRAEGRVHHPDIRKRGCPKALGPSRG